MEGKRDLLDHFMRYFEVVRADTPMLLEEVFRLRYNVYCEEGTVPGFDPEDYPDGLERDVYDERSVHCLLRHRPSGAFAGTVRLVCADPVRPDAPFPVEAAAGQQIEFEFQSAASRCSVGECSRFILARQFRSRKGEERWPDGLASGNDAGESGDRRRALAHPILGLLKAGMIMSWERQVSHWYAAMEPRLDRRLRQFAFALRPVSPMVDYHGPCRAHWGYLPEVLAHMRKWCPEVWRLLTENGEIWPLPGEELARAAPH
jgi:N-acyl amino acid synthase of PEP-CTERM/exosortase system